MGDTFAISALDRKRDEIAGTIDAAEARLKFLRASLVHLDAVAALFQSEREALGTEPLLGRPSARYFARAELSRLVMDAMRTNPGPSPADVTAIIMELREMSPTDRTAHLIRKAVGRAIRRMRERKRSPGE